RKSGGAAASFNLRLAEQNPLDQIRAKVPFPAKDRPDERLAFEVVREADRMLMMRFAPPAVIINESMDIVQFRGNTEHYLSPAPGEASLNILRMAREGLLFELRSAIQ